MYKREKKYQRGRVKSEKGGSGWRDAGLETVGTKHLRRRKHVGGSNPGDRDFATGKVKEEWLRTELVKSIERGTKTWIAGGKGRGKGGACWKC